ncbi:F0F1 ATP synthase subunit gamma [Microbulbifer hainanensis]|uniref:F0F1 ATP synthase subunit gamma n=1 Tax=Microbulbifer hainanensis TaxID=2735675 RepID=UPI001866CEC5|nr:FoF1 ATP synthase subunit gamma [Microbulbifer hainanensis]
MSRRRALQHQWQKLSEAREIVSSMKSLAFMETRRLARFVDIQRQAVLTMEEAAADFLAAYPDVLPRAQLGRRVFLLLGSERGFCGNFNEALVHALEPKLREPGGETAGIVACGQKLCAKLEGHPQLLTGLDGAAVGDEMDSVLIRLTKVLGELQQREGAIALSVLHHDMEQEEVVTRELLPPFGALDPPQHAGGYPPQLNLTPPEFLLELVDQYLFAALQEILTLSLMAENNRRLHHLEGAVHYLDDNLESLRRKSNQVRQEQITEEIEVILLSVESAVPPVEEE